MMTEDLFNLEASRGMMNDKGRAIRPVVHRASSLLRGEN